MRFRSAKRQKLGAKRPNIALFRSVFEDRRIHTDIGIVQPDDDGPHYRIDTENNDVLVEVVLQPSLVPVTCKLMMPGGIWCIPNAGEEVAVFMPGGQLDGTPFCIPFFASADGLPEDLAVNRTVIVRTMVIVHDGTGGAKAVAYADHTHLDSNGMETTTAISGTLPNPSYNPMLPVGPTNPLLISAGDDGGTTTFKAK